MNQNMLDTLIIGGGPAGLTAAIYTSRAELSTLVVAGRPAGGQLLNTTEVENYPGFPQGIMGPELISNMRAQAERFNATFVDENVLNVSGDHKSGFEVKTDEGKSYTARSLILATGANARWLGLESETRLKGHGVSACATCDGFFFKGKAVAVVGAGDSAMEESSFLTKFCTKVYVLVRKGKQDMKASKIMLQRAINNSKIEFIYNVEVEEVLGTSSVDGLKLKDTLTGTSKVLADVRGLFLAIGHTPSTEFLKGFVELDKLGYVVVNQGTHTSVEGVFVGGDVSDHRYRQAITAAGLGCMAALDAERFVTEQKNNA